MVSPVPTIIQRVMGSSKSITPASEVSAICEALMAGEFYASSGVLLDDVTFAHGELTLRVHTEPGVSYRTEFRGTRRGFDRSSHAVTHDGSPLGGVTRRYSDDVGAVLATVKGPNATYRLRGDELYVRAIVTADVKPVNPVWKDQKQQAWTQPVGWR